MALWFDERYYLAAKLTSMVQSGQSAPGVENTEGLKNYMAASGMDPQEHYLRYGRSEGLNPDAWFNESEYLSAKLASLQENPATSAEWTGKNTETLRDYLINTAGMLPVEHYILFGWSETRSDGTFLNPSNAFDTTAYLSGKLDQLRAIGYTDPLTGKAADAMDPADLAATFRALGADPLTHYYSYGAQEEMAHNLGYVHSVHASQRVQEDFMRAVIGQAIEPHYGHATSDPDLAPNVTGLTAFGDTVSIHLDQPVCSVFLPHASAFTVKVNGSAVQAAVKENTGGNASCVELSLDQTVNPLDVVTVSYSDSPINDLYAVQNRDGHDAGSFYDRAATYAAPQPPSDLAPVIEGLPAALQRVPAGKEINLKGLTITDTDNDPLLVSLTSHNGAIGGVQDEDPDTAGFQIRGTSAQVNAKLASLNFTALEKGAAYVDIAVTDGKETAEATYAMLSLGSSAFHLGDNKYAYLLDAYNINYSFMLQDDWGQPASLTMIHPDILDAEKTEELSGGTHDNDMCWAAAAANILAWSGWAQQSALAIAEGRDAEDAVFNVFKDNFLYGDKFGGVTANGLQWFFDGSYDSSSAGEEIDRPAPGTGNYLGHDAEAYVGFVGVVNEKSALMPAIIDTALDLGLGMELSVTLYPTFDFTEGKGQGGHAITCWGYVYDSTYAPPTDHEDKSFDPRYLAGVIVSDSDDGRQTPPELAPNRLKVLELEWDSRSQSYFTQSYGPYAQIDNLTVILPNSSLYDRDAYAEALGLLGISGDDDSSDGLWAAMA